jgi:hypothetical protein
LCSALEAIPVEDFQCSSFKVEPPHRKPIPYIVEGYHLPDPDMNPIDLLPKGVEIRTPIYNSIDECLAALKTLHARLQQCLQQVGYKAVALSFHPTGVSFEGPQNKRRHDFWQWAMTAMLTYGPDVKAVGDLAGSPSDGFRPRSAQHSLVEEIALGRNNSSKSFRVIVAGTRPSCRHLAVRRVSFGPNAGRCGAFAA